MVISISHGLNIYKIHNKDSFNGGGLIRDIPEESGIGFSSGSGM